ncbi:MAG: DUF1351 domain-containing protein [Ruminococcaceae bacterium]|nr:DUF1351 domain-containing protein [Oscillospiraceae bacterium]
MELKVNEIMLPEAIRFNYEELKTELSAKIQKYETMVYSEAEIKTAKEDVANLRKLKKALNDERNRLEKEYMQPFNEFKQQVNEIIAIIDKPVLMIDGQIKEFDEFKKQEKHKEIEECFDSFTKPEWLTLEQIFNPKWLNVSVSMKSVTSEIITILETIDANLATLQNLPEFSFEAVEAYKTSLDINKAIQEGKRLSDIQKKKAEQEETMKQASEKVAPTEAPETPEAQKLQEVCFRCWLTTADAVALKGFFMNRNIKFEAI